MTSGNVCYRTFETLKAYWAFVWVKKVKLLVAIAVSWAWQLN